MACDFHNVAAAFREPLETGSGGCQASQQQGWSWHAVSLYSLDSWSLNLELLPGLPRENSLLNLTLCPPQPTLCTLLCPTNSFASLSICSHFAVCSISLLFQALSVESSLGFIESNLWNLGRKGTEFLRSSAATNSPMYSFVLTCGGILIPVSFW